jgi:cytochrome b
MSTMSESRADATVDAAVRRPVLVWDVPVRVFHWLMVLSFAGAYLTAESERWRLLHVTLGYTMAGLVAFRLIWGVMGTRYARFSSFVRGPKAVVRYLGSLLRGQPEHHTGHNPAGALAIVALLVLALAVTASGWGTYNDMSGEWLEEVHEAAANLMLALVGVHIFAVLLSTWLHKENLVRAMITGRKPGLPEDGIRRAWRTVAVLMLAAVLGFWWLQWQDAPSVSGLSDQPGAHIEVGEDLSPGRITRVGTNGAEGGAFEELSVGAREQMGVVARLAYADLLQAAGKPTLLILDDALVNTDQERLGQMKRVLYDAAARHQILIFSCHPQAWQDLGVAARSLV